ncbi:MAG: hypothetical protein CEE40_02325 [Chloroflexi bacterium B3_Chlor]|nr:MAG: hypothetical protein CEE40_02325 [Chloroflexi bacterium B3_Chlor]
MKRYALNSFLAVAMVIVAFLANYAVFGGPELHNDFYYIAWRPGRALMQGQNPYQAPHFLRYPLWTLVLSLPLAWLPLSIAMTSWTLLSEFAALGFLTATTRSLDWQLSPKAFGLLAVLSLIFRPSLASIVHGQYLFITLFFVGLSLLALHRKRNALAGVCLAMSLLKPQLVFLVVAGLLAWTVVQRRWSAVVSFLSTALALVAVSHAFLPGWVDDWLLLINEKQLQSKTFIVPSVWGLAHSLSSSQWVLVASILSLILLAALACLWWRHRNSMAYLPLLTAATIVVTQIVTPKAWNYDHTMLLLPLLYCLHKVSRPGGISRPVRWSWLAVLLGWLMVLPHILSYWASSHHSEIPYALLPITMGILLLSIEAWGSTTGTSRGVVAVDEPAP